MVNMEWHDHKLREFPMSRLHSGLLIVNANHHVIPRILRVIQLESANNKREELEILSRSTRIQWQLTVQPLTRTRSCRWCLAASSQVVIHGSNLITLVNLVIMALSQYGAGSDQSLLAPYLPARSLGWAGRLAASKAGCCFGHISLLFLLMQVFALPRSPSGAFQSPLPFQRCRRQECRVT